MCAREGHVWNSLNSNNVWGGKSNLCYGNNNAQSKSI